MGGFSGRFGFSRVRSRCLSFLQLILPPFPDFWFLHKNTPDPTGTGITGFMANQATNTHGARQELAR